MGDDVGQYLFATGGYEEAEVTDFLRWAERERPATTFPHAVEVGANVGSTSILIGEAGYELIAVEPVKRTFDLLSRNVHDNHLDGRIRCVRAAVVDREGFVHMVQSKGLGLSELATDGGGYGFDRWGFGQSGTEQVAGRRIEALLADHGIDPGDVAFVWSDVQGAEQGVIDSGHGLWAAGVPLWLEVWPYAIARHGGLPAFLDSVESHFRRFATPGELGDGGRPIRQFREFVARLGEISDTDVLLQSAP